MCECVHVCVCVHERARSSSIRCMCLGQKLSGREGEKPHVVHQKRSLGFRFCMAEPWGERRVGGTPVAPAGPGSFGPTAMRAYVPGRGGALPAHRRRKCEPKSPSRRCAHRVPPGLAQQGRGGKATGWKVADQGQFCALVLPAWSRVGVACRWL